jgi:hypothetical protein
LAVGFFALAGCEAWERSRAGEIRVGDVVYLSGRNQVQIANLEPIKIDDKMVEARGGCHASLGATFTVLVKYDVKGVKNLLLKYTPPKNESCAICCPEGTLTSIRERDWQELRKTSEDMRERWLVTEFEAEAEKEVVKKYLESKKAGKK